MPKVTLVANTPQEIFRAKFGNLGRPARLTLRVDPDATDAKVYISSLADVTAGTNADTDGVPLLASEPFSDPMITGEVWYAVTDAVSVDVYYTVNGAQSK